MIIKDPEAGRKVIHGPDRLVDENCSQSGQWKDGQAERIGLVVLGMHRSGTSALARVVSLLGAALPDDLEGANASNERGYWESRRLIRLHDQMLAEARSRWDDWQAFDAAVLGPERLAFYKHEIGRVITEEYGHASFLVLKDPRICRFVPLWEEALARLGIEPRYFLIHRNPLAVMASLAKRNDMTEEFVSLVWLRHVIDAERATRGKPRAVLSYEGLLADWRSTIARAGTLLGLAWPRRIDEAAAEIEAHLCRNLQHHEPTLADLETNGRVAVWVKQSYAALLALSSDVRERHESLAALTCAGTEFDAGAIFGRAAFSELAARERRMSATTRQLARLNQAVADQQKALANALRRKTMQLERELARVYASRSWRITAPLRFARHALHVALGGLRRRLSAAARESNLRTRH